MLDTSLPLYRVLIQEYNAQTRQQSALQKKWPPIPEGEWVEAAAAREKSLAEDVGDVDAQQRLAKKVNAEMTARFYAWLHEHGIERSALCFSGGGIRSATFGLGVLQGLARSGLIETFDYLSTVSGGGYLGSWLSAWIHRRGLGNVQKRLRNAPPKSPLQPEAEPLQHLRVYSNYMSPRWSLLSADTWSLVAIYVRNLLLNWLVLVPFIAAVLLIPRLSAVVVRYQSPAEWMRQVVFWIGLAAGVCAIAYIYANRPSSADRMTTAKRSLFGGEFPADRKSEGWFLLYCLLPLAVLAVCATTYYAWLPAPLDRAAFVALGGYHLSPLIAFVVFGIVLHVGGLLVAFYWVWRSSLKAYVWEFVFAVVAGGLGGLLLYALADRFFPSIQTLSGSSYNDRGHITDVASYACLAAPLFLFLFFLTTTLFVGLASKHTSDEDREWLARAAAWWLIVGAVWCIVSGLVIFVPVLLEDWHAQIVRVLFGSTTVLSGLVTLLVGWSSKSPANEQEGQKSSTISSLSNAGLSLAALIFAATLLVLLSMLTGWVITKLASHIGYDSFCKMCFAARHHSYWLCILYCSPFRLLLALLLALIAIGLIAGLFININKFSFHAAYRDRLIRAYPGASRNDWERKPNPFTGFDPKDNVQMQELRTELFHRDSFLNLYSLVPRLRATTDVSQFVWGSLSPSTQELLSSYDRPPGPPPPPPAADPNYDGACDALAADLNCLIQGAPLHGEKVFSDWFELPPCNPKKDEINELRKQTPLVETLRLNRLLLELVYEGEIKEAEMCKPLHVVNITLNLVGGRNLAWQDRKAESFTVSALHSGSYCVGYRDSREYAYTKTPAGAITLGTATAISGAAVSPNMGYHSSTFVTFLMTLFNVRLGWWLGNPGAAGADTFNLPGPYFAPKPIIAEALGLTDDQHRYVYLSDGGHFENLGLYEMVLRRCRLIVVSDGTGDPQYTFADLANAISKIRVDLGVPIKFKRRATNPGAHQAPIGHDYYAVASLCYSCVDQLPAGKTAADIDGTLIYIKASLNGSEPVDITNYAKAHPFFPHESTGDQMYSEEQFESYRELGSHVINSMTSGLAASPSGDSTTLQTLFGLIKARAGAPPDCADEG